MSEENEIATAEKLHQPVTKRQRSSIAFPYMDLSEAMELACAIHKNVGTGTCSVDQLAPWLNQSPNSSGFRIRLATSRLFGLVDTERGDALKLTDLGKAILDPKRERECRAKAFLQVPLYRALFEKFKGGVIPPAAALEKEMVALGVAETLKERARPVFERSADQAGFFESGRDRLVLPGYVSSESASENNENGDKGSGGGGGGNDGGGGDDETPDRLGLMRQLLRYLPDELTNEKLAQWLRAAEMNLRITHDVPGEIKITVVKPNEEDK